MWSEPKPLLVLIGSLVSGGQERQAASLANALVEQGMPVTLALLTDRHESAYEIDPRVQLLALGRGGVIGAMLATVRLYHLAGRFGVIYSMLDVANVLSGLVGRLRQVRVVWAVGSSGVSPGWVPSLAFGIAKWLSPRADLMISNAHRVEAFYLGRGFRPKRSVVITNGIDTHRFHPEGPENLRIDLSLPAPIRLVGCVGRLHPVKRIDLLCEAMGEVSKRRADTHLVLIGQGMTASSAELKGWLDRHDLTERTHLLGERTDMPPLYRGLDLVVCSSDFEGMSNSVLEALASGVPCVSTDVGDSARVLLPECVVPVGDASALATAIMRVLDDASLAEHAATYGRGRVRELYALERLASATLEALQGR